MATSNVTPTSTVTKEPPVIRTVFDLDSFDEVTLQKAVPFSPVSSIEEANKVLGHDAAKFLAIVNTGLRTELRNAAVSDTSIPWMVADEKGNLTPFSGTAADNKVVSALRLNLAKNVFGYKSDEQGGNAESRSAAKEKALEFIRGNQQIRDGLKISAAPAESEA
jgi:hypothetical protein